MINWFKNVKKVKTLNILVTFVASLLYMQYIVTFMQFVPTVSSVNKQ